MVVEVFLTVNSIRHLDDTSMIYVAAFFAGKDVNNVHFLWHALQPPEMLPEFIFLSRQGYEHGDRGEHRGVWLVALTTVEIAKTVVSLAFGSQKPPRCKVGGNVKHSWVPVGWGWNVKPSVYSLGECLEKFEDYDEHGLDSVNVMLGLVNVEININPASGYKDGTPYEHEVLQKIASDMVDVFKGFLEK